jgi:hypothetical protein
MNESAMKRPDTFTITTFWMDWLLQPIVLGAVWLTARWALADVRLASGLGTWGVVLTWIVSLPLLLSAAGWLVIGFGMLVKEEYWEFRLIRSGLVMWALCCLAGAGLVVLGFLFGAGVLGLAGLLNLAGLVLMFLTIVLPARVDPSSVRRVIRVGRLWYLLLVISVGCLLAGMFLGFPYNFTHFPLAVGAFFLIGLGITEVAFGKTSFPWFFRLFQFGLGRDYHDSFPESTAWRIEGAVKVLLGIGAVVVLIITSLS